MTFFTLPASWRSLRPNQLLVPLALVLLLLVIGRSASEHWNSRVDEISQAIELRQLQRDKYTRIVQNSAAYEELNHSLRRLQETVDEQHLFKAATDALSQARFQNLIKELAGKNRIDIRSTRVMPVRVQDQVRLVAVRIDAKAEIGAIRDFLLDLRAAEAYVFVPDLQVRTINEREQRYYYLTAELVAIQDL